jgi:predicted phage tail protein
MAQDGIPCPAEPTTMSIAYGDAVTCTLQNASDTDVFTFAGMAGEVIIVNALSVCLTLAAPGGGSVDACGASRNRIDAVLSETGTFTLTSRAGTAITPSYTVALERVIPASAPARSLQYGDTLQDQINVAGDIDLFSFEGAVNDTVSIVASTAQNMPPCIELIAPDNTRSTACGLGSTHQIDVTLLLAGSYGVLVRQGDTIGFTAAWSYSVQLQCVAGACFTAPAPPAGLTGSVSTHVTSLTWNAPTTGRPPTSYVIEAGTAPGLSDILAFDTLSTSTVFMAPGIPNGTYFVRVKSRNSVGTSGPSNEITITGAAACTVVPGAPANFVAMASGFVASFQWAAASGNPTSYVLEAGSSPGATNVASVDVGLTTQFATPAPAGTYFVRVRARNACGLGPASNEVTLVVGCPGPPAAPSDLTFTVSGPVVTLSWPAAAGQPTSYVVEAGSASGSSNLVNVDVGNRLTISANALPGTYFVRVRARNQCGTSAPTIERTVVVP